MKAIIYARVSTSTQDYERQIADLREYASKMGYEVVKEFSEKVSGAKKVAEREQLSELMDYIQTHKVDKVLIYECSRLSRSVYTPKRFRDLATRRHSQSDCPTGSRYHGTVQLYGAWTDTLTHGKRLQSLPQRGRQGRTQRGLPQE